MTELIVNTLFDIKNIGKFLSSNLENILKKEINHKKIIKLCRRFF